MLSIARSRLAVLVQLAFLGTHSAGLLLSAIYNGRVPDLYPNNAHHRLGWIVTWVMVVHFAIGVIKLAVDIGKPGDAGSSQERTSLFPSSLNDAESEHLYQRVQSPDPYRYSGDSGHYTASEGSQSHSVSSSGEQAHEEKQKLREHEAAHTCMGSAFAEKSGLLNSPKLERVATRLTEVISTKTLRILDHVLNLINRTILLLGFISIVSGMAVYGGVFVSIRNLVRELCADLLSSVAWGSSAVWLIQSKEASSFGTAC